MYALRTYGSKVKSPLIERTASEQFQAGERVAARKKASTEAGRLCGVYEYRLQALYRHHRHHGGVQVSEIMGIFSVSF
jgi:hypothetical protein